MAKLPAHRFVSYVNSFAPQQKILPLMHSTFGRRFISILDTNEVRVGRKDDILNKAVSFHFYGKPSYRPENSGLFSRTIESSLFCLLLNPEHLPTPCSMLPFDSGGYAERFSEICDRIELREFFLQPANDAPARLVAAFFGSNERYWFMKLRDGIENDIEQFDVHSASLVRLCTLAGPVPYDQRAFTIEIHYDCTITLTRDNLLAVVVPDVAEHNPELLDFASNLDADIVPYKLDLDETSARQRQVRDAVYGWLSTHGYL